MYTLREVVKNQQSKFFESSVRSDIGVRSTVLASSSRVSCRIECAIYAYTANILCQYLYSAWEVREPKKMQLSNGICTATEVRQ